MRRGSRIQTYLVLLVAFVFQWLATSPESSAGEKPTAEEMMIRAHEARAVWRDFPGFTAEVALHTGDSVLNRDLTVTAEGDVNISKTESNHPAVEWAEGVLQSLVDHRQPTDNASYNVAFADEVTTHPLGRRIKFHDDRLHSVYRILDDVITEVQRTMGQTRFTISVIEVTRNPKNKYLPKTYTVSFWDAENGDLKRTILSHNTWTRKGHFDLPETILRIRTADDGERQVREIRLSNHRLFRASKDARQRR